MLFSYIKQSYLLTSGWIYDMVANVEGFDDKTKKKLQFYTRQFVDALSPSNFAMTNPEWCALPLVRWSEPDQCPERVCWGDLRTRQGQAQYAG
ncbi:MAG: hypothetical protein IPL99_26380 [Candidatus Competibacteraceae bacterium]|nr:hypothetical protein [Candidatus Competibacteraceae bacterium]